MANENDYREKEKARLMEERQREEQRVAEVRRKVDKQTQERLQKESERRRKEQQERKEHLKQLEEMKKQREQNLADKEVGGGKGREIENYLAKERQLAIQANKEGKGAKQEKPYKIQEQGEKSIGIEKLRTFEKSVHSKLEATRKKQERIQEMSRTR